MTQPQAILCIAKIVLLGYFLHAYAQVSSVSSAYYTANIRFQGTKQVLEVSTRSRGMVIWKRYVGAVSGNILRWSHGQQTLAFAEEQGGILKSLIIWRAGNRVKRISLRADDGMMNIEWSPDDRRLLVRTWRSGGLDLDSGTLWCVRIADGHYKIIAEGVRRAQWLTNRRVRFWTVSSGGTRVPDKRASEQNRTVPPEAKQPQTRECL